MDRQEIPVILDKFNAELQGALGEIINPKIVRKNSLSGIARISAGISEALFSRRTSNKKKTFGFNSV